jgi:hypothetical protein
MPGNGVCVVWRAMFPPLPQQKQLRRTQHHAAVENAWTFATSSSLVGIESEIDAYTMLMNAGLTISDALKSLLMDSISKDRRMPKDAIAS